MYVRVLELVLSYAPNLTYQTKTENLTLKAQKRILEEKP